MSDMTPKQARTFQRINDDWGIASYTQEEGSTTIRCKLENGEVVLIDATGHPYDPRDEEEDAA